MDHHHLVMVQTNPGGGGGRGCKDNEAEESEEEYELDVANEAEKASSSATYLAYMSVEEHLSTLKALINVFSVEIMYLYLLHSFYWFTIVKQPLIDILFHLSNIYVKLFLATF